MLKKTLLALAIISLHQWTTPQELEVLVQSKYPQAYAWYCDMAKKYPQANLSNIKFCIFTYHHASSDAIFWPEYNLRIINDSYQSSNPISDANRLLMQQDEYLLLHEATHVNNNHVTKGKIASAAAATAGAGITIGSIAQVATQAAPILTAATQTVVGNIALATAVFAYARSQEKQADDFANKNVDKSALEAGIQWHANNHQELQLSPQLTPLQQTTQEICADPAHPSPQNRQEASQQVFDQRFMLPS